MNRVSFSLKLGMKNSPTSRLLWLLQIVGWLLISNPAFAQLPGTVAAEPMGSLLIVGGGDTPDAVQQRFVALAGGEGHAKIAVFPMASMKSDEEANEVVEDFRKLGAETHLVSLNRNSVNRESTARYLEQFTGYWFSGGDQSRLAGLLLGTKALDAMYRRYHEGAVIGGTSAGASVMSSVMLTGKRRTPKTPEDKELQNIARGMQEVSEGFGVFKGAIVDQHFMHRARYNRLISAVLDHPQLLGVGIDEETALLVRPDGLWEVIGSYYVKIFDARRSRIIDDEGPMAKASDIRMHILPMGSTFDPQKRRVVF
ncbi:MAG: cyanophycinase [Proteobacteria bacterium]|nr:cyanophycinase [Pseudomonadota bacterium]